MKRRQTIVLLAAVLAVAIAAAAVAGASSRRSDRTITQRAIGGALLGWSQKQYVRTLHRPFMLGRLEGGITLLSFTRLGINVYLQRGVGVAISTYDASYRTSAGVGPCSPVSALTAAYGRRLRELLPRSPVALYRLGALIFRVYPRPGRPRAQVGAVTLGTGWVARAVAGNSQDCRSTPATAAATPSDRLVLAGREVPGLRARPAQPVVARSVLERSLSPAVLSRLAAVQTQVAHFVRQGGDLWSIAFVLKTPAAAKTALGAFAAAVHRSHQLVQRVALGDAGLVLGEPAAGRRPFVVVWRRGRVLEAIVFSARLQPAAIRTIAIAYARLVDVRVARALTQTAWERTLGHIGPKGQISRQTALDLFALAYGPLPGTKRPPGRTGRIESGTFVARNIFRLWATLTPAQQTAALRLLGLNGVDFSRRVKSARVPARAGRDIDYGDPTFTPDVAVQKAAEDFAKIYQQETGHALKLTIVAGLTQDVKPTVLGAATPIDSKGNASANPTYCRIRITPKGQAAPAAIHLEVIAHEVFHCMQFSMVGASTWAQASSGDWVGQGTAEWAALRVTGLDWPLATAFQTYLTDCEVPLYGRGEDALGFFGHSDDVTGEFWSWVTKVVQEGFTRGNDAAYAAAGGDQEAFLDTWPSSVLIRPKRGFAWTMSSPVKPPERSGCEPIPIWNSSAISAQPVSTFPYITDGFDPRRPLLHVQIHQGYARISDGQLVDENVRDKWYCLEGLCECPPGSEGIPPPAPSLGFPAILALTGGRQWGLGEVEYVSLEQFCKQKQPPPKPICPPGGTKGMRVTSGSGSPMRESGCPGGAQPAPMPGDSGKDEPAPDPIECTGYGCAYSSADPHLLPFGGNWYDFQGAGEFTLLRSTSGDLEVQVRQEPWPGSDVVSMNTAVAMRVGSNRVSIYRGRPLTVHLNHRAVVLGKTELPLSGGGKLRGLNQGQVEVVWPDGSVVRVLRPTDFSIDLILNVAKARLGKVTGLLGNANGVQSDDFRTRGGQRLDPAAIQGADSRAYRLLYRVFGDSWRISQRDSLFDYPPGQSTRTFTKPGFPARIATVDALTPAVRRKAEHICGRMNFTSSRVREACTLDVAQTGNYGFATALAVSEVEGRKKTAKPPPPSTTQPSPSRGVSATATYRGKKYSFSGGYCRTEGGNFFVTSGTENPSDNKPYFAIGIPSAPKDGTYKGSFIVITFDADKEVVNSKEATVTLVGSRTRGTFQGIRLGTNEPFSGSFNCS